MKKNVNKILAVLCLGLCFSCGKPDMPEILKELIDCQSNKIDELEQLKSELRGTWALKVQCFSGGCIDQTNRRLTVDFMTDSTLAVIEKGIPIDTVNWELKEGGSFQIISDPRLSEISGTITLCNNVVEFSEGNLDGVNKYFQKFD